MKVEIELPDWCDERDIYVMAGVELAAFKFGAEKKFHVKTTRCVQCGVCCTKNPKSPYYPVDEKGWCSKLIEAGPGKWICGIAEHRPWPCSVGDPVMYQWGKDFCSIRYDEKKKKRR